MSARSNTRTQIAQRHSGRDRSDRRRESLEMLDLHTAGVPIDQIADRYKLSETTIRRRLEMAWSLRASDSVEAYRAKESERLDLAYNRLERLLGLPTTTPAQAAKIISQQADLTDKRARLLGLNVPVTQQVEAHVTHESEQDRQIKDLLGEFQSREQEPSHVEPSHVEP